jgi:hypothetical protein
MREQPMPAGDVDDAAAALTTSHPPGDLPRLVKFLARKAAGPAYRPADVVE